MFTCDWIHLIEIQFSGILQVLDPRFRMNRLTHSTMESCFIFYNFLESSLCSLCLARVSCTLSSSILCLWLFQFNIPVDKIITSTSTIVISVFHNDFSRFLRFPKNQLQSVIIVVYRYQLLLMSLINKVLQKMAWN